MARLAATDLTVTVISKGVVGKRRRMYGSVSIPSTSLTYTIATGIPLPAARFFGFRASVDNMFLTVGAVAGATDWIFKYDKTNHSVRVYRSAGFTQTGTVSQPTFTGTALSVTGTVAAPTFTGTALTPTGTVSQPTFTGTEWTEGTSGDSHTPTGTVSIPTFTGTALSVTGTVGVPAFTGTSLTPTGTVSQPTFTGTAVGAAALAEFTDNVALGSTVTLYYDAIGK